jgi:hypothetical protein
MPSAPSGNLYNTTGHLLTKTNRVTLRWTGTRWVYTRTVKGKKVTREVKKPATPSPPKSSPAKPKRKYTRKIGPRRQRKAQAMSSTNFANKGGRVFFKTSRGSYVIRDGSKSLYQRKARYYQGALIKSLANVPLKIRPKKVPKKKRITTRKRMGRVALF